MPHANRRKADVYSYAITITITITLKRSPLIRLSTIVVEAFLPGQKCHVLKLRRDEK